MSGLPQPFIDACQADEVSVAALVEIGFAAGTARFTTWSETLSFAGANWVPRGMELEPTDNGSELQITTGTLRLDNVDEIMGGYFAVNHYSLRGTPVKIHLVVTTLLGDPDYKLTLFDGAVKLPLLNESEATLELASRLSWMERRGPDQYYSRECRWTFGGVNCGAVVDNESGAAEAGSDTETVIDSAALTQADNYWAGGEIEFLTGALAGVRRGILSSSQAGGSVTLEWALSAAPAVGDGFRVTAGCRKTFDDCDKWGNAPAFTGFHCVPGLEVDG